MTDDRREAMIDFAERVYSEMTATLIEVKKALETMDVVREQGVHAVRKLQRNLKEIEDLTQVLRDNGEPK